MTALSPLVTGWTGDIRGLKWHTIKHDWVRPSGFMEMFYCYIMSPLPVTASGAHDLPDISYLMDDLSFHDMENTKLIQLKNNQTI